ncbi:protein grindelwald [Stomoxys calcitrans]|uniref:Protein grindelwald n=1 Tax=Stomoxys calcitrans TaxID=35570 RepID=A0A1I8PEP6_STOCA|nr:protein grindelwald [Stomoxys calcitrans]
MLDINALKSTATLLAIPAAALRTSVGALNAASEMSRGTDCHGHICHPVEQFCYQFEAACANCSNVCNSKDAKYEPNECTRECGDYLKLQPLKNEIHQIQMQQSVILYLLILLLIITCLHYTWKCLKWLRHKRCVQQAIKKLKLRRKDPLPPTTHVNGKDLGGTTIQNMCVINDIERAPSQIYSMTGAEGSVMTVTTPISSRHPAENSTPSPQPNEYSYDNQALAVTPVSEKPGGSAVF